ncbi:hypothetical protein RRG37_03490 [Mycoplasmopsis felis]|uniref:hypothetical protein n=1 Tax=Mycoplasmopsis felis TaxID=33923 RepID=UPI002AFF024E|nr:hypothetical protein [Mycoplasmopsis felis]WQQ06396.1 hypothetical protein RRG40_00995 [Mycoplasmopsis felis]
MQQVLEKIKELKNNKKLSHFYIFNFKEKNEDDFLLSLINILYDKKLDNNTELNNISSNIILIDGTSKIIKKEEVETSFYNSIMLSNSNLVLIIIKNIENSTANTLNSFLKFIEEPSPNILIVSTTQKVNKILPTIISRAQVININTKKETNNNWTNIHYSITKQKDVPEDILRTNEKIFNKFSELFINHFQKLNLNSCIELTYYIKTNINKKDDFLLLTLIYLSNVSNVFFSQIKEMQELKIILHNDKSINHYQKFCELLYDFFDKISNYNLDFQIQKTSWLIKFTEMYE